MIKYIVYHTGYVENSSTSLMVYQCQFFGCYGYASAKEAVVDLALDLYSKYIDDVLAYRKPTSKCCETASLLGASSIAEIREKYKVCTKCGVELQDRTFDQDDFCSYLHRLHNSTCDSYGEAEVTSTRDLTWWPYWSSHFIGAPKSEILYIGESAEYVFLSALYSVKPELMPKENAYASSFWNAIVEGKHDGGFKSENK